MSFISNFKRFIPISVKNCIKYKPWMGDKYYLEKLFKKTMGRELNTKNPQTFSEKLQWIKLYDRNPEYTRMVDKYEAKNYIAEKVGKDYLIPTLGVWDNFNKINFNELPNSFVIKTTHDSGGIVICANKNDLDIKRTKEIVNKSLKTDYWITKREWAYKNVKPRIIAETYIGKDLRDYRFYCFNGEPKFVYVYTNKSHTSIEKPEPAYCDIFDIDWKLMPFHQNSLNSGFVIDKPSNFNKMVDIAKKLSNNVPFLRVDYYEVNNQLYIGELTLYPGAGFAKFYPDSYDKKIGDLVLLKQN